MKSCVKKTLCILLTLCFMSMNAFAANGVSETTESIVQPRFTYIWHATVGLGIDPNGYSTCDTGVTLYESYHSAKIVMSLQRYEDSDWENVKTWTITDDGPDVDLTKHWYVVSGYDYQVQSDIYVYNQNNQIIEIITEYSPVVEF